MELVASNGIATVGSIFQTRGNHKITNMIGHKTELDLLVVRKQLLLGTAVGILGGRANSDADTNKTM